MQREVTAIVLCILAQAATAQCGGPTATTTETGAPSIVAGANAVQNHNQPPARAELIKTAAAGTRDDEPPAMARPHAPGQQDHPRRGGTAMLLAALALMSCIALRRFGSRDA